MTKPGNAAIVAGFVVVAAVLAGMTLRILALQEQLAKIFALMGFGQWAAASLPPAIQM